MPSSAQQRPAPVDPAHLPGRPCSVAAGLDLVGDRWVLLIVRELLFGNHRFDRLAVNTGAPRDRLSARLRHLEAAGLVERVPYSEHPKRFEYHLTAAGRDLAPVVDALRAWGDRWAVDSPPLAMRHSCGHDLHRVAVCAACGEPVREGEVAPRSLRPEWDLSGPTG